MKAAVDVLRPEKFVIAAKKMIKNAIKRVQLGGRNLFESAHYQIVKNRGYIRTPGKIIFVCTGNICRSAFAEKLLQAEINSSFPRIESCGLDVQVSCHSPVEAISAADKVGLDLGGHKSKSIDRCYLEDADLILAMELWQYRQLRLLYPHKWREIKLLREFAPFPENLLCNINDPFGNSERAFVSCFAQIRRSLANIKMLINRAAT